MKDRSAIEQGIVVAIEGVLQRLRAHAREIARSEELTLPQLLTLLAIYRLPRPTPAVVAEEARLSRSTMTSVLDRLEQRGLVRRERTDADRRKVVLCLTAEGRARANALPMPMQDMLERRLGTVPDEQLVRIAEGLALLVEVLG